jgi:dCTP deaminase
MLADFEIRKGIETGQIGIRPFNDDRLQPVSYDLTLHPVVRVPDPYVTRLNLFGDYEGDADWPHAYTRKQATDQAVLRPGDFLLASTQETVHLDSTMAARVEGKSSLGRIGLAVHITAGFIDPGFVGQITLEVKNVAPWEIPLRSGMLIAQIVFEQVNAPARDYGQTGRYQGQQGPTESRYRPMG